MKSLINCLAIGGAGFFGALARYGVGVCFGRWFGGATFPIGTLVINITGSFFLGWFHTFMSTRYLGPHAETLRLGVATGFVGAYTTFSTYMFESDTLFGKGASLEGLSYVFGSIALGLLFVHLGVLLGRA